MLTVWNSKHADTAAGLSVSDQGMYFWVMLELVGKIREHSIRIHALPQNLFEVRRFIHNAGAAGLKDWWIKFSNPADPDPEIREIRVRVSPGDFCYLNVYPRESATLEHKVRKTELRELCEKVIQYFTI